MVILWRKERAKLKELERRVAELERNADRHREQTGPMAIPADIISEWLNGKKQA